MIFSPESCDDHPATRPVMGFNLPNIITYYPRSHISIGMDTQTDLLTLDRSTSSRLIAFFSGNTSDPSVFDMNLPWWLLFTGNLGSDSVTKPDKWIPHSHTVKITQILTSQGCKEVTPCQILCVLMNDLRELPWKNMFSHLRGPAHKNLFIYIYIFYMYAACANLHVSEFQSPEPSRFYSPLNRA